MCVSDPHAFLGDRIGAKRDCVSSLIVTLRLRFVLGFHDVEFAHGQAMRHYLCFCCSSLIRRLLLDDCFCRGRKLAGGVGADQERTICFFQWFGVLSWVCRWFFVLVLAAVLVFVGHWVGAVRSASNILPKTTFSC